LDYESHRKRRLETCVYRVVVCLEEFAQSIDGFGVHREITEEVNKILVAHASLDQLKCVLLQRRVHSIGQTANGCDLNRVCRRILKEFSAASYAGAPVCSTAVQNVTFNRSAGMEEVSPAI